MKRNGFILKILTCLLIFGLIVIGCVFTQENPVTIILEDMTFQKNIDFDDFSTKEYEYGVMYIEKRIYENNLELVNKYKRLTSEMPIIKKYLYKDNTFFDFTGYIIDDENNVCIMNVQLKLLDDITIIDKDLLNGFNINDNEIDNLKRTINEQDNYITKGNDANGAYTIYKNLYVNDSFEIEDNFGMAYAFVLYFNNNIDSEKISRRLMYYIMEFTY